MSGRVLNFGEFFDKYSKGNAQELGLDSIIQSQSNFEEGFDDETYDQKPIGPRRPVSGNYEETPAQPDANTFAPDLTDDSMEAPEETDEFEETPDEFEETPDEFDMNSEEESEDNEEESDDDVPEPEAGANPKLDESLELKGFDSFIIESYRQVDSKADLDDSDDYYDEKVCPGCEEDIEYSEMGANCGCNPKY